MRFKMPSIPAISCAVNAKYGFADGSGARNSMRLAAGLSPVSGIRIAAERLDWEYARFTGASKPGDRRRQECTVGVGSAKTAGAGTGRRPMEARAAAESRGGRAA